MAGTTTLLPDGRTPGIPMPGLFWGPYPERADAHDARAPQRAAPHRPAPGRRLAALGRAIATLEALDDAALDAQRLQLQRALAGEGLRPRHVEQAVALAAEAARRSLGKRAYEGQLLAALQLLDEKLVEMATGEGKSLATALAAAAAALAGMPVHVLTANDYLVQRDADGFRPLFERLGLRVASVVAGMGGELRRLAYAQPVVYVTAKELVFDYLRDRLLRGRRAALQQRAAALDGDGRGAPLLRGLCMGLIDEADSVLIDEAQMPLILSREHKDAAERAYRWQAWSLSGQLVEGRDFERLPLRQQVLLTEAGRERTAQLAQPLPALWRSSRHREHAISVALVARHQLVRDRDYLLREEAGPEGQKVERIVIVDAVSGRLAEGRRWSRGLHAMVALKEGCKPEPELETLAQLTFQRFFRRYHRLGGLSGTLSESRAELLALYGLPIVTVAPRLPPQRRLQPTRVFAGAEARWAAVAARCAALAAAGRPVLVGTESVADSQALSALLTASGLPHAVLNARHDADEAAIVARAGEAGRITVATNMAGRGTDIELDARARAAGGLHVLCCQLNPSRRLDRQLIGRAARQGQPGSAETWLALDTPRLSADAGGRLAARLMRLALNPTGTGWGAHCRSLWLRLCLAALQRHDEHRRARARTQLFRQDCEAERGLSFADGP